MPEPGLLPLALGPPAQHLPHGIRYQGAPVCAPYEQGSVHFAGAEAQHRAPCPGNVGRLEEATEREGADDVVVFGGYCALDLWAIGDGHAGDTGPGTGDVVDVRRANVGQAGIAVHGGSEEEVRVEWVSRAHRQYECVM